MSKIDWKKAYNDGMAEYKFYISKISFPKIQNLSVFLIKLSLWILAILLIVEFMKFPELNYGEEFPAKSDRTHDLSIIITKKINKKWSVSAIFVYATGNSLTLPIGRYLIDENVINQYDKRNSYRMDPYHRADISIEYLQKKTSKYESSWNFSVYNLYNRQNPYFIYFDNTGSFEEGTWETRAKQVSLFPILPSVSWNFKF